MLTLDKAEFLQTLTAALPRANVRDNTKAPAQRAELHAIAKAFNAQHNHIVQLGSGALHNRQVKNE